MTSKGSGRSYKRDLNRRRLDNDHQKYAVRALDLRGALEFYGVRFNGHGAALCPFHNEKTASFRVKGDYWHCFGCGESGDLIKFVRKTFGMNYTDALDAICRDFGIAASAPSIADQERIDRLRVERYNIIRGYQRLLDYRDACIDLYLYAYDVLEHIKQYGGGASLDNERYVSAQFNLLRARNTLEQAEYDCAQYLRDNPGALQKLHDAHNTHNTHEKR